MRINLVLIHCHYGAGHVLMIWFLLFSLLSQRIWLPLQPSKKVTGAARQRNYLMWLCLEARPLLSKRWITVLVSRIPVYGLTVCSYALLRPIFQFHILFLLPFLVCVRLVACWVIYLPVFP